MRKYIWSVKMSYQKAYLAKENEHYGRENMSSIGIQVSESLRAPLSLVKRSVPQSSDLSYRTEFMRDRDRVLYSRAFRRLAGKTQVYIAGADDHLRTRLTHTLEVSQIARTIAQQLQLDCDLTEAIALGHDIGHAPFGHAGERMLHQLMTEGWESNDGEQVVIPTERCGFKHNLQGVATSVLAEKNYEQNGLALTNFTLWGIQAHSSGCYKNETAEKLGYYQSFKENYYVKDSTEQLAWSFEAFVVREADEIAQRHHDLEDAVLGELITPAEIVKSIREIFDQFLTDEDHDMLNHMSKTTDSQVYIAYMAKLIVNFFVTRIIKKSSENLNWLIQEKGLTSENFADYVKGTKPAEPSKLIAYDAIPEINRENGELFSTAANKFKEFISSRVLASYDIQKADSKGQYIIRKLFRAFITSPLQLPDHCVLEYMQNVEPNTEWIAQRDEKGMGSVRNQFCAIVEKQRTVEEELELRRVVCNYIAGMTDNYAKQMFDEIYK